MAALKKAVTAGGRLFNPCTTTRRPWPMTNGPEVLSLQAQVEICLVVWQKLYLACSSFKEQMQTCPSTQLGCALVLVRSSMWYLTQFMSQYGYRPGHINGIWLKKVLDTFSFFLLVAAPHWYNGVVNVHAFAGRNRSWRELTGLYSCIIFWHLGKTKY